MLLVDLEVVREMVESQDPDAVLIFTEGGCVVATLGETAAPETGVLIARRREIVSGFSGGTVPEEKLRALAHRLDNTARDLGT